jgi:NarL family two-component system response regulator LiaR
MMPVMDGLTATQILHERHPLLPVLILSSYIEGQLVSNAIAAGAAGYILKNGDIHELTKAILAVHQGEPYLSPQVSRLLMQVLAHRDKPTLGHDLTERENDVLKLVTKGYTNRQIAATLEIAPATVKFHMGNILSKLGVGSRTEAVVKALEYDLLDHKRVEIQA